MIKRTLEAKLFNEAANHPEVHPWMGYDGEIDLTAAAENIDNFFLTDRQSGGFAMIKLSEGLYEVHTIFKPESKPSGIVDLVAEGMDYMFTRTDCHTLVTQLPLNNKPAHILATTVGFKTMFQREDTPRGPTEFTRFTLDEWVHQTPSLLKDGQWFHEKLEGAKAAIGSEMPTHLDDPAHDQAVGAAVRMIRRDNAYKGVDYYNTWARFAGYAPITLLSDSPIVVDVLDAVVEVMDGDMEIIKCR